MIDREIQITGINFADYKIAETGRRIIAFFNVEAFGIEIRGCKLIRTEKDGLTVTAPSLDDDRAAQRRAISFKGDLTRSAILKAARKAYSALGGVDLPPWANKEHLA
jgi:hypothetical protein